MGMCIVTSTKRLVTTQKISRSQCNSATPRSFASGLIDRKRTMSDWFGIENWLVGGWSLPLWKMMEIVSWDDEIPNIWKITRGYFLLIPPFWLVNSLWSPWITIMKFPTEWKVIKFHGSSHHQAVDMHGVSMVIPFSPKPGAAQML